MATHTDTTKQKRDLAPKDATAVPKPVEAVAKAASKQPSKTAPAHVAKSEPATKPEPAAKAPLAAASKPVTAAAPVKVEPVTAPAPAVKPAPKAETAAPKPASAKVTLPELAAAKPPVPAKPVAAAPEAPKPAAKVEAPKKPSPAPANSNAKDAAPAPAVAKAAPVAEPASKPVVAKPVLPAAPKAASAAKTIDTPVAIGVGASSAQFTEINETVLAFVRKEGEAVFAHLQALTKVKSPAELIRLQVGEFQRAADSSLSCISTIVRSASRIGGARPY